ncbi:MAG: hypothetical protein LBC85_03065 [Fibromonadaceae bacterium]|jgi:hypothetical protein|nr:hypothetical protein [Fibromonadaceae bacterium]
MNRTKKISAFATAMLFGTTLAVAQPTGDQSGEGSFLFTVERTLDIQCIDDAAATNDDNEMVLGAGETTAENAAAEIVCTIETNYPHWNMTIEAANSGKLVDVGTTSLVFTTDAVSDGTLTFWGEFDGTPGVKTATNKSILYADAAATTGTAINLSSKVDNLAEEFSVSANWFMAGAGLQTATFTLKAGVAGDVVTAEPGTYGEDIDITLITDVP